MRRVTQAMGSAAAGSLDIGLAPLGESLIDKRYVTYRFSASPGDKILTLSGQIKGMGLILAFVGALIAYGLFSSGDAKRRPEYSGMEKSMILLGMVAFGALFFIL